MSLREAINRPTARYVAGGAIVLAILVAWTTLYGGKTATTSATPALLKCAACGEVLRTNVEFVNTHAKRFFPDPLAPGVECPKCGKNELVLAQECPKDHTIFFGIRLPKDAGQASQQKEGTPKCPQCGWDPAEEQQKQILRSLGK